MQNVKFELTDGFVFRALTPFHFNAFLKKVSYAWPVPDTTYNQRSHFLLLGSGTPTTYSC